MDFQKSFFRLNWHSEDGPRARRKWFIFRNRAEFKGKIIYGLQSEKHKFLQVGQRRTLMPNDSFLSKLNLRTETKSDPSYYASMESWENLSPSIEHWGTPISDHPARYLFVFLIIICWNLRVLKLFYINSIWKIQHLVEGLDPVKCLFSNENALLFSVNFAADISRINKDYFNVS